MGVLGWLRVIDTVSGLAEASKRFRRPAESEPASTGGPFGPLESRLTGVVVAALKEAFDRDRARLDLERDHIEVERRRAEAALRLEMRRQAAERIIGQLRIAAALAAIIWVTSALLLAALPGMRAFTPRVLLGAGWGALTITFVLAFAGYQQITRRLADSGGGDISSRLAAAAPWLLVIGFACTASSLLAAL
jgi:small-conductance mechanosensitive channel